MGVRDLVLAIAMTGCRGILGIDTPIEVADAPTGHVHADGGADAAIDADAPFDAPNPIDAPPGTPAAVQSTYGDPDGNLQTAMATFMVAQAAGNFNVVAVGWLDTNTSITGVSDIAGSTYVAVSPQISHNGTRQQLYYAYVARAGANTITVQFDGNASYPDVRAAEYTNIAATNPIDGIVTNTGSSNKCDSGLLTTTHANDVLVASNVMNVFTTAAGPGFTERSLSQPDEDLLEDQFVTAMGSYRAQMTLDESAGWSIQLVAFKGL